MKYLILLLLLLICVKWIIFMLVCPWVCLFFQFKKHKGLLMKLLAVPGYLLEELTNTGTSRFLIINIGYIPSLTLRLLFYRLLGVKTEKHVVMHYRTEIRAPYKLQIGTGTIIGDNALLDARNGLNIGRHVNLSSNVSIYTEQHNYQDPLFLCSQEREKSVEIGDRAWIGSNVVILPGVKIGESAVCAAGSVITKDVKPFEVVAGIPAKKITDRTHDLRYEFDGTSCWFY